MKNYKALLLRGKRASALIVAFGLAFGAAAPLLISATASATGSGGLISTRSMELSSAAPNAPNVTYTLTFTPVTTEASGEMIIDFCGDTPIIGATCAFSSSTVPTVATGTAPVTLSGVTYSAGSGTAKGIGSGTPIHTVQLTGLTLTAGTPYSVTFTTFTNPSTATSFYARVLTYATGGSSSYTPASTTGGTTATGSYVDWGGIAMSTTSTITIDATVMEQLTFCVSGSSLSTSTCTSATSPNLTLGQGSPAVLSSSTVSTGADYTQLSTNAQSGAVINLKALNTCNGLSSNGGTSCGIPGIGAFATPSAGQGFFGLNVSNGTDATGGTGSTTANSNYGTTAGKYGMGTNVTTTYGDTIASAAAPCSLVDNTLTWGAQSANTTPAGLYSANESLIATGTF